MNSIIFRTMAPIIVAIMLVFAVYIVLRGHNAPGGGFIGGLIAASAMAILGMAKGATAARQALRVDPMAIAGCGILLAGLSGLVSLLVGAPFMTSQWLDMDFGQSISLSTPMVFDIGVFLVVFGAFTAVTLALEQGEAR